METKEKVIGILKELSGKDEIRDEESLSNDLALDSLKMITMLVKIEEELQIELSQEDMDPFKLKNAGDVVSMASKYTDNKEKETNEQV